MTQAALESYCSKQDSKSSVVVEATGNWSPGNEQKKSQAFARLLYLDRVFAPRALSRFGMYREFNFLFFLNVREDRKQVLRLRISLFAKHPH